MIWRRLVYRLTGIAPRLIEFAYRHQDIIGQSIHGPRVWRYRCWKTYRYQWDEHRRDCYDNDSPDSPPWGAEQSIDIHWTSRPTVTQQKMIDDRMTELPATTDDDTGALIQHFIYRSPNSPTEILNFKQLSLLGFQGIALMRTCKRIIQEVAEILYGENYLIFDTRRPLSYLDEPGLKTFQSTSHRIPGFPFQDGTIPEKRHIVRAIHRMFDKHDWVPQWLKENPFTGFLRRIGPFNASLLTRIKFEGHFRGLSNNDDFRPLEFAQLLPIYQAILGNLCGNLQEVILHNGPRPEDHLYIDTTSTIKGPSGKTNEKKIDDAVERFVKGLPWLRKLQLGDYKTINDREQDIEWSTARRWVTFIDNRSTEDVLRPTASKFVQNYDDQIRRGGQRGRRERDSQGQGGRGGNSNTAPNTEHEQEHKQQNVDADINEKDDQGSASRGEPSTRRENRRGRSIRGGRGREGHRGGNNISTTGHRNEGRHIVIGTAANESGHYDSSRGESSRGGNGRGSHCGRGTRGEPRRFNRTL